LHWEFRLLASACSLICWSRGRAWILRGRGSCGNGSQGEQSPKRQHNERGLDESKPAFGTLSGVLDADAVFHVAAIVACVGVKIVRGAMIQQIPGTKISSNIDANRYRTGRYRCPPNDANPRLFRNANIHFLHVFRPNLP
jgi:hypothetical protein